MNINAPDQKESNQAKMKKKDTVRVFIAVNLPGFVKEKLSEIQSELKQWRMNVKWTRIENIHLTLKFLGDISRDKLEPISRVVETACSGFEPVKLMAKGVGVFPGVKRPRVLWTGVAGQTDKLGLLQGEIDHGLSSVGFQKEKRQFTGHLTLGRFKQSPHPEKILDIMNRFKDMETGPFLTDTVYIYQSDLKPSGPVYSELGAIKL
jgi:2'-5' RNA ligase